MELQLWYQSEDLAALPLFSDNISDNVKSNTVNVLQGNPFFRWYLPCCAEQFPWISKKSALRSLSHNIHLTSSRHIACQRIFDDFSRHVARMCWLHISTEDCSVRALKVINNCAERAVKLVSDCNEILTKNGDQRQLLYQVIENYRKLLPANERKKQLARSNT